MLGSLVGVGKRIFEPFPALDSVTQAVTTAAALIVGGTYLGVKIDGLLGLSIVLFALFLLAFRAAFVLQRQLDTEPELGLAYEPRLAESDFYAKGVSIMGAERYIRIVATAKGKEAATYAEALIVACERLDRDEFLPHERFLGSIRCQWPKDPMGSTATIEPDVPEVLIVATVLTEKKEREGVYLGTITGIGGVRLEAPGEYRILVRLRAAYVSDYTERWFRITLPDLDHIQLSEETGGPL